MQSVIENFHPHIPEDEPVDDGDRRLDAKQQAAQESWELMQLVQRGRAEGATARDIQKGEEAFAAIYDRYYGTVFKNVLRRVNGNYTVAEDILTDTFLRAFKSAERYVWQGKDLAAWLNSIANNLVIDNSRNPYARHVRHSLDDDESVRQWADDSRLGRPEAEALGSLRRDELIEAIRRLSDLQQKVIVLRYLEERTIEETAGILGKSEDAIKGLAFRGTRALRIILEQMEQTPRPHIRSPHKEFPHQPLTQIDQATDTLDAPSGDFVVEPEDIPYDENALATPGRQPAKQAVEDIDWEQSTLLAEAEAGYKTHETYTKAIKRHGFLPPEQLEGLAYQIALAQEAQERLVTEEELDDEQVGELHAYLDLGNRARRIIAAHNLRLVVGIAMGYRGNVAELDDLIQIGNIGLMKAVDKYNPYYGWEGESIPNQQINPFTTGAHSYIRGHILRYLYVERRAQSVMAPVDDDMAQLLHRSYEEARRLNPRVTHDEVGEWLGFSSAAVQEILGGVATRNVISLNALRPDQTKEISDTLADPSGEMEFRQVENSLASPEKLWQYIGKHLTEREYTVLREYHVHEKTQQTIADEMNYSRQSITAIVGAAHHKIKILFKEGPDVLKSLGRSKPAEKLPIDHSRRLFNKLGIFAAETEDTTKLRAWVMSKIKELDVAEDAKSAIIWHYDLETGGMGMTQDEIAERLVCSKRQVSVLEGMVMQQLRAWSQVAPERRQTGHKPGESQVSRERRGPAKRKDGARVFFRKLGISIDQDADPLELRAQLAEIFTSIGLSPVERAIAEARYGLSTEDGLEMSQVETADKLGLSRGYVSKIDPEVRKRARLHLGLAEPKKDIQFLK